MIRLAVTLRNDLHVVSCFIVRRYTVVLGNQSLARVVTRECELDVPSNLFNNQLRYFVPASMFSTGSCGSSQPKRFAVSGINCINP